jgi:uncharacterized protein YuzE
MLFFSVHALGQMKRRRIERDEVREALDSRETTVSVSDLVMVDLSESGEPVGVEFAVPPSHITGEMLDRLVNAFPALKSLRDTDTWLLTHAH